MPCSLFPVPTLRAAELPWLRVARDVAVADGHADHVRADGAQTPHQLRPRRKTTQPRSQGCRDPIQYVNHFSSTIYIKKDLEFCFNFTYFRHVNTLHYI